MSLFRLNFRKQIGKTGMYVSTRDVLPDVTNALQQSAAVVLPSWIGKLVYSVLFALVVIPVIVAAVAFAIM